MLFPLHEERHVLSIYKKDLQNNYQEGERKGEILHNTPPLNKGKLALTPPKIS